MTSPKVEPRKTSKLEPHEYHAEIYPDLPEGEFRALVENIRTNGIRVPLEILPDGRIIAGRHRYRAAIELGLETVPVVVRHDLAEAGEAAIRSRLVEDNLVRRQLSPIVQARALLALIELRCRRPRGRLTDAERAELRAQIAERLGMSDRSANRYLAVLRTPRPVQDAFERGTLSITLAARVATLLPGVQREVADALEADPEARPKAIVADYLDARVLPHIRALRAYTRLLHDLKAGVEQLSGQLASIPRYAVGVAWQLSTLRSARKLVKELIAHEKEAIADDEE